MARVGVPRYLATSWEFCPPLASLGLLPQLIIAFMKLGEPELRRGSAEPSSSFLPGKSMWVLYAELASMLNSPPASPTSSCSLLTPLLLLDESPEPRPRPPLLPEVVVETAPASENCFANMRDIVVAGSGGVVVVVVVVSPRGGGGCLVVWSQPASQGN